MKLIVFSGLPGTGKSSLAETIGREMGIPVFAKDWLMGVVEPFDVQLAPIANAQLGYGLLTMLARRQLMLVQSAILDSVLGLVEGRREWQALADEYGAAFYAIETICSDVELHRSRLEGRTRGIPGWNEISWADVERTRGYFEAWDGERLIVDAVEPLERNLAMVRRYLA